MTDSTAEKINAVGNFITKLTGSRIALAFVMALLGIIAYSLFEARAEVFNVILKSTALMISIGVGSAISLVGWLFSLAISKIEITQQKVESAQQQRIEFLESDVRDDHKRIFEDLETLIKHHEKSETK